MFIGSLTKRFLIAFMWFGVVIEIPGQTQPLTLQLTTKILSKEYCKGDSELDGVRLKLRLIYTNKSKQNLLLFKGSRLVSRIMISRDSEKAAANHFEVNSLLTQVTNGGGDCYKGAVPSECFVVLPPGASYGTDAVAGTFAVRGDVREVVGAVKSGNHVLQVEVITWQETNELAKELRARWLWSGLLWYEPVTSEPVAFTIPRFRRVVDCQ